MEINNIVDIWRIQSPISKLFTWHRKSQKSRLDYFLVSEHLLNEHIISNILPANLICHSIISHCLKDREYVEKIRDFKRYK